MPRTKAQPIRLGIFGAWRGAGFAQLAPLVGLAPVAVCDQWEARANQVAERLGITAYTDFDRFLEHDLDAVVLCNYFHQHAPYALRCLQAGKHVMSETAACKTLAEGVALARAAEKSKAVYFFAENYPFFATNQEMRRLYRTGEIGECRFAEGEYVHPLTAEESNHLAPGLYHWRNWLPVTYYCTHALAPLMYVTDLMPTTVNAQAIPRTAEQLAEPHVRRNDISCYMMLRMNSEAVFGLNGACNGLSGHGNWYRFQGTRGLMETFRMGYMEKVRVVHEPFNLPEGGSRERIYTPEFPVAAELAARAGHGGGDFFVMHHFAEAIRGGEQPWLNVYRALAMSVVGIQGWRSALDNGAAYPIPDFSDEATRAAYEHDHWSPFPEDAGPGQPPVSVQGAIKPTRAQIAAARRVWKQMGYGGE
jgi:predicted dehydrogenase